MSDMAKNQTKEKHSPEGQPENLYYQLKKSLNLERAKQIDQKYDMQIPQCSFTKKFKPNDNSLKNNQATLDQSPSKHIQDSQQKIDISLNGNFVQNSSFANNKTPQKLKQKKAINQKVFILDETADERVNHHSSTSLSPDFKIKKTRRASANQMNQNTTHQNRRKCPSVQQSHRKQRKKRIKDDTIHINLQNQAIKLTPYVRKPNSKNQYNLHKQKKKEQAKSQCAHGKNFKEKQQIDAENLKEKIVQKKCFFQKQMDLRSNSSSCKKKQNQSSPKRKQQTQGQSFRNEQIRKNLLDRINRQSKILTQDDQQEEHRFVDDGCEIYVRKKKPQQVYNRIHAKTESFDQLLSRQRKRELPQHNTTEISTASNLFPTNFPSEQQLRDRIYSQNYWGENKTLSKKYPYLRKTSAVDRLFTEKGQLLTCKFHCDSKMHNFSPSRKRRSFDSFQCKTCLKLKQKQSESCLQMLRSSAKNERKKSISSLRNHSFQYFVYEYKSMGQGSSMCSPSPVSFSQPKIFMKRKNKDDIVSEIGGQMFGHNRSRSSERKKSSPNVISTSFEGMIKHKKIETAPQRPSSVSMGKNFKRRSVQNNSNPVKGGQTIQQNFVKPWESGVQERDEIY